MAKKGAFAKSFEYALRRTVHETVRDHNRRVRPNISAKEDARLAYHAYKAASMFR